MDRSWSRRRFMVTAAQCATGAGALSLSPRIAFAATEAARGPLRVSTDNPRYFADPAGNIVYLTGSHTWAALVERRFADGPLFDYERYLDFLNEHYHNFFRMWAWEHAAWMQFAPPQQVVLYHPHPWLRTGPGNARDGQPKFDISRFDEAFFKRMRQRVEAAGRRGIYVAVMFFQGFSVEQKGTKGVNAKLGNPWDGHPFHRDNNINGIDGDPNNDGEGIETHTMAIPAITRVQEAYVRKVIDTLSDLDNVLWEIGNECHTGSVQWQYHMIDFIRAYEAGKAKQHPIGMTGAPIDNDALYTSKADWISPMRPFRDPPPADGRKVVISDTDHLWGIGGDAAWVWRTFTRGHQPIFMDPYLDVRSAKSFAAEDRHTYDPQWDPIRRAMGHTRRFAERMNLKHALPLPDRASSGYCLAKPTSPGAQYLIYVPAGQETIMIDLTGMIGQMSMERFDPQSARTERQIGINLPQSRRLAIHRRNLAEQVLLFDEPAD